MKNVSKILIAVFAFCTIMTGCSKSDLTGNFKKEPQKVTNLQNGNQTKENNQNKYFELPDKIQLIDKGKRLKMLTADDNLYKQIIDLTNERFNTNIDSLRCIVTRDDLKTLENNELVLEFIYLGPKQTEFYNQFLPSIKQYVRLLMPLTNSVSKNLYIDDGKGSPLSPLSNLLPPDKLLDLVNKSNIKNTSSSDTGKPGFIYTNNKDKPVSSFVSKNIIRQYVDEYQGKTPNSKILSIELKTFSEYLKQDEPNSNYVLMIVEPDRMVYVVKTSYPDGINTKAGYISNAILLTVYDAETGNCLLTVSGSADKFK